MDEVARHNRVIGARHHGDHVLAVGADHDQCRAGRGEGFTDAGQIDLAVAQQRQRLGGEIILADRADHAHRGAGACGGQRLVGALAAGRRDETGAPNGLAGSGQAVDAGDKVEVDRADNDDQASLLLNAREANL